MLGRRRSGRQRTNKANAGIDPDGLTSIYNVDFKGDGVSRMTLFGF